MTPLDNGNPFKSRLRSGSDPLYGLWLCLGDPTTAEICAGAGFDFLVVDAEHGPNDLRSTRAILQVLAAYGSHPVVRLPVGEPWMLKQYLDIGVRTVLIPMVDTPEQAAALAAAVRYPPDGIRGLASPVVRASGYDRRPDYVHRANDETCLLVQIETAEGLSNLDAIAAVPGIDGLFVGPADLSASLGHTGNPSAPPAMAAIEDALARITACGKPAGIIWGDDALIRRAVELGARYIATGTDVGLLSRGADALAARYRLPVARVAETGGPTVY
ncbi:MAG: HpcH/HpaI aldolase/citrate lyase family protein [Gluconacetobacter diazotrophicus]|nr:HpcH/HpaI aldolase/citrate lyase family protein [Gluconacetobacter diazotrophicus]